MRSCNVKILRGLWNEDLFRVLGIRPLGAACGGHPQGARIDGPGSMPTILISSSTLSCG